MQILLLSNTRGNRNPEIHEQIRRWFPKGAMVCYIPTKDDPNGKYHKEINTFLEPNVPELNLQYLDIHKGRLSGEQLSVLAESDGVYIAGGNTYLLLQALRKSKALELLQDAVCKKPTIGTSAGGIVLSPDINFKKWKRENVGLKDTSGLDILPFGFMPHYVPGDAETESSIRDYLKDHKVLYALPEHSGLVVEGDKITPLGEVYIYKKGAKHPEKIGDKSLKLR